MAVDSRDGTSGRPIFLGTSAPDTAGDLTTLGTEVYTRGTRLIGTTTERNSYSYPVDGLLWWDTTVDAEYVYSGSAWVRLLPVQQEDEVAAIGSVAGAANVVKTITFPTAFTSIPYVVPRIRDASWPPELDIYIRGITTSGCTFIVTNRGSVTRTAGAVDWVAIGNAA